MKSTLVCHDGRRRETTRARGLNGLDYLEVSPSGDELFVYLLGKFPFYKPPGNREGELVPVPISRANFRIAGGRRVPEVKVLEARVKLAGKLDRDDVIIISVERSNDLSNYTLQLQRDPRGGDDDLLRHFDPRFTSLEFTFGVDCPSDLDCAQLPVSPPGRLAEPNIDYLARDYSALRKLILDRLSLVAPDWQVRYAPDISMALVELLAYVGDHLSYYQDAVATESYLGTARRRISLRRHARLVDYVMHEGCNARAFVCIDTSRDFGPFDPQQMLFLTAAANGSPHEPRVMSADDARDHLRERVVFMPLPEPEKVEFDATDIQDWEEIYRGMHEYANPSPAAPGSESEESKNAFVGRIWSLLGDALQTQLKAGGPYDPRWQRALLASLNRVLHDRSFASATAATSEQEVIEINRRQIAEGLGEAIVKRESVIFREAHSRLRFYTWGDVDCFLPKGATAATLWDEYLADDGVKNSAIAAGEYPPDDAADPSSTKRQHSKKYEQQTGFSESEKPEPRRRKLRLRVNDILIIEEVVGPTTGLPADRDPTRRHPIRLTRVVRSEDPVIPAAGSKAKDKSAFVPQPVVEIEWAEEDALPFPICISVQAPADTRGRPCRLLEDVSVARGNVLLVDHGREVDPKEQIGIVECETVARECRCEGTVADPITKPRLFCPELGETEITFAEKLACDLPAARMLRQDPRRAVPAVKVTSTPAAADGQSSLFSWENLANVGRLARRLADELKAGLASDSPAKQLFGRLPGSLRKTVSALDKNADEKAEISDADARNLSDALSQMLGHWEPRQDLLGSGEEDRHFVLEMDDERRGHLRFGFDGLGRTPAAGETFRAKYRVGNGLAGNVGAEKITHMVLLGESGVGIDLNVRNPLPAQGGTAPESAEEVRRNAPYAFRREIERAITPEDYRAIAERHPKIQRAAAELRWRNGRYLARVAVDPLGSEVAPRALVDEIQSELERCRRIGHDVEVISAVLVPLRINLHVCVCQNFQPGHVKQALLEAFGNRRRSDGTPGFFHPDSLTFGSAIRMSKIVAVAQGVTGVASARVTELRRYLSPAANELREGLLHFGPLEIPRCDNDPSFPENGILTVEVENAS